MNFRLIRSGDISEVAQLMKETNANYIGLSSKNALLILCREALQRSELSIVCAEEDGMIVGYGIALSNYKNFWKPFLIRHPTLLIKILIKKYKRAKPKAPLNQSNPTPNIVTPSESVTSGRSWEDNGPEIAKIIHVGVSPRVRGRRVGGKIQSKIFEILRARGIKRVDGTVNVENIAAVKMDERIGWKFVPTDTGWFVTMDL